MMGPGDRWLVSHLALAQFGPLSVPATLESKVAPGSHSL